MARGDLKALATRVGTLGLDSLRIAAVAGASADTDIAVTGIKRADKLLSVIEVEATSAGLTDRTATTSITSDGNVQCTADTSSDGLIVVWVKGRRNG